MCLALYLFTNNSIPESQWDEANPGVFVQITNEGEDRNAHEWPHAVKNIYYIGGYQGCGCGWAPVSELDEADEAKAKHRDRLEFSRILRSINLDTSWFVVCWEGDQGQAMKPISVITIEQVEDPLFEFDELRQYKIAQQGNSGGRLRRR